MTRVHHILFPFVGGDIVGGSHLSALKLIAGLNPDRYRPRIVLHGGEGRLARVIEDHGLTYQMLSHPGIIAPRYSRRDSDVSPLRYLTRSVPALRRLLCDWGIDLVHTNDGRMHGSWALPARLAGCRFVWHHRQSPDAFGVNWIAPVMAHQIITVSRFSRPRRPVWPLKGRLQVVHSPFDLTPARPDRTKAAASLRAALNLSPETVVLGYFGALNPRKRPVHFVRVIAALQSAFPDRRIHGAVFGKPERDGDPIAETCAALAAELGIRDRLHMMGHLSPIEPWLAGVDALLVTALEEPFGRTLIEAMHLGTPVIATNHGGNPEAITDHVTGFLVDHADPAAFVSPVRKLLSQPLLNDQITRTAALGLERFSTAAHIGQIEAVYDTLLKGAATAPVRIRHA